MPPNTLDRPFRRMPTDAAHFGDLVRRVAIHQQLTDMKVGCRQLSHSAANCINDLDVARLFVSCFLRDCNLFEALFLSSFAASHHGELAISAIYEHLRARDDNPVVVCPTGAGKSLLIAQIAGDAVTRWNGRVLVLAHVQELLEQNADKIRRLCPDVKVGIYSAGLKQRDTASSIICAGIQSIYRRACELDAFDLVIVDEVHLIPTEGDGMYRQFLADAEVINPHLRVIGMTATPFRLKSGLICSPDHFLNHICFEIGIRELIRDGYLCSLVTKAGKTKAHTETVSVRGGEFVPGELESLMNRDALVEAACTEIIERTADRNSCLMFATGVDHGRHIARVLGEQHGVECGFVCGETPPTERDELLARFRGDSSGTLFGREPLKYLCNVNVLTTGFDAPNIDCIALLRPTMSPGLYYQMVGRGFRLHPGKENCLVLDFGGNVLRHGPVDQIKVVERSGNGTGQAPAKECPECQAVISAGYAVCPDCGYQFPPPDRQKHEAKASDAGILSGEVSPTHLRVNALRRGLSTSRFGLSPRKSKSSDPNPDERIVRMGGPAASNFPEDDTVRRNTSRKLQDRRVFSGMEC